MPIMEEIYKSNIPRITWAVLFPRSLCSKFKKILKKSNPEFLKKNLREGEGEEMQKIIVRVLLPEKYRRMHDGSDITDTHKTQFSRYFNYYDDNFGASQYETVKRHILNEAKSSAWNFDTFPFIQSLKKNLKSLFEILPQELVDEYKKDVQYLIQLFDKDPVLKDYKQDLSKKDFYSQMSCLTGIAATWHCWYHSEDDAIDLSLFLMPTQKSNISIEKNDWKIFYIDKEKATALEMLNEARKLIFEQKDYHSGANRCAQIIKKNFADELVIGEAYYHLAICCIDHGYKAPNKLDYKELLSRAVANGYVDALNRLHMEMGEPASSSLLRPITDTYGTAKIILNSENVYSEAFLNSIPSEMKNEDVYNRMIITASTKEILVHSVHPNEDCRFLLIHKSLEKNFQDLLYLLDRIMFLERNTQKNNATNSSMHWSKTTIYIRISEERYSTLIDTALKRLGNFTVKVFMIDDNKWSAQYLLNRYPLFKPFEFLSQIKLKNNPVILNFTIISKGNIELTSWLIREAFWLGCFHYPGVALSINLISPDLHTIKSQLHFHCPDMFNEIPDSTHVSKVYMFHNSYEIESLSSPELINALNEQNDLPNTFHYYVINTDDDIENLNYGIKIREWSIRNAIESGKKPQKKELPTIAFYCKNSDIAYLSQNMVVQMVDHGNLWYNNHNLIPFGMLSDRYSWEEIDGGHLERIAESTHLQYCGSKPTDDEETKIIHLKDYFSRCYNRDSSMAVALSMPYRLFQTAYCGKDHILPNEKSNNIYSTKNDRNIYETMAECFQAAILDPMRSNETKNLLLKYEHSRWLRWAISRGWKKATPEQVINYMNSGNPKHQLYIARLHGCICPLDNLKVLSEEMCNCAGNTSGDNWKRFADKRTATYRKTGNDRQILDVYTYEPKDFTAIDKSNIEATAEIITTAWFSNKTKEDAHISNDRIF